MAKKFFAYFDLLGFSEVLENNNLKENLRLYDNIQISLQIAISKNYLLSNYTPDLTSLNFNSITFSDSFFMWTNEENPRALRDMILSISYLYWYGAHYHNLFLRGAITMGDFEYKKFEKTINGHSFEHFTTVGEALVKAATLEKNQEWAGCIIADDIIKLQLDELKELERENIIISYDVPFKDGNKNNYCINWLSDDRIYCHKDLREKFLSDGKKLEKKGAISIFEKTESFVNTISERGQFANYKPYFRP